MIRIILLFLVVLFIEAYAFQAFRNLYGSWRTWGALVYLLTSAFVVLWLVASIAGWTDALADQIPFYTYVRAFVFILLFSKLAVILPLLLDDVFRLMRAFYRYFILDGNTGGYWPSRSKFLSKLGLIMGGIPLFLLTYGMLKNPFRFQLRTLEVPLKGLPAELDGLKIVQISDLHSGTFKNAAMFQPAIDLINGQNPDIVVFTGDMVNYSAEECDSYVPLMRSIQAKYGKYSILGNHDYGDYVDWTSEEERDRNMQHLFDNHRKMGYHLMRNQSSHLKIGDASISILGVENYSALPQFPKYGDLKATFSNSEKADFYLLLTHDPTHWDAEVTTDYPDIQLALSGHTHGFQFGIEIPGFIRWSPSQWVYKRWAGLYRKKNQYLYVNRGLGCLAYPGRVGILPEVTSIKLRAV